MANKRVTVTIDETDWLLMENDILDVKEWVENAVIGKTNNCWKRFRTQWVAKLMDDDSFTDAIPSDKDGLVALVMGRDDYFNRAQRDALDFEEN